MSSLTVRVILGEALRIATRGKGTHTEETACDLIQNLLSTRPQRISNLALES